MDCHTEYLSDEEIAEKLTNLSDVQFAKLHEICKIKASKLRHMEGTDLFLKTYDAILNNQKRKWPKNIDVVPFFIMVAQSFADMRNVGATESNAIVLYENEKKHDVIEHHVPDVEDDPELIASAAEILEQFEKSIVDDETAFFVYMLQQEDKSPKEIQEELNISKTEYDSKMRFIRRKLLKFKERPEVQS